MAVSGITTAAGALPYDGTGIGIALLDSGINDREDLRTPAGIIASFTNRVLCPMTAKPDDAYGHGNHVAGLVAGNGKKSTGTQYDYRVRGIAPNAKIISLRVLDKNGVGTDSGVISAIHRAIELKSTYNIRVMNLSFGRPVSESCTLDPLCQAVQQAWQAGIVVVVAAGNDGRDNSASTNGYATVNCPANNPFVITVGAVNTQGTVSRLTTR